jgi:hypothetical protein
MACIYFKQQDSSLAILLLKLCRILTVVYSEIGGFRTSVPEESNLLGSDSVSLGFLMMKAP